MKSWKVLLLLVSICFIAGCAEYYYQEGTSFNKCSRDRDACYAELEKRVDVVTASDYEFKFMEACMRQKGYQIVTEDKLPLSVKRHRPDQSVSWFRRGLAGTLE